MSVAGPRFTYEDYKLLPEGKRYEIIEGDLLVIPTPTIRHQRLLLHLVVELGSFVTERGLGTVLPAPMDVILSDENVVQPDLLFVARQRQGILDPAGGVHGAPDLVVEIFSAATAGRDQVVKRKLYGKYGVREYWIVDPTARSVEVLTVGQTGLDTWRVFPTGSLLSSPLLVGLSIPTTELVAD